MCVVLKTRLESVVCTSISGVYCIKKTHDYKLMITTVRRSNTGAVTDILVLCILVIFECAEPWSKDS